MIRPGTSAEPDAYGAVEGPATLEGTRRSVPRGSILVIRPGADGSPQPLSGAIERVSRYVLNAPVAIWPDGIGPDQGLRLVSIARQRGIGTVITCPDPPARALREDLTDPTSLPDAVLGWLHYRRWSGEPATREILREMLAHSLQHHSLEDYSRSSGTSSRTLRRAFDRDGLGSAARWYTALRVVAIATRIQRNPKESLELIADQVGYSSAAVLSDRLADATGARPTQIRRLLGWHWILVDSMRRLRLRILDLGQ
jgi:AraC-like DNA-binding protein